MVSMDDKSPLVKSCAATRATRLLVAVVGAACVLLVNWVGLGAAW